jgi:hypothetical protein
MQALSIAIQIITFLAQHKDDIKAIVLNIEQMMGDMPGNSKAQAVKDFIGQAMAIEGQMEAAWPIVAPIFNLFVAAVKAPKAA